MTSVSARPPSQLGKAGHELESLARPTERSTEKPADRSAEAKRAAAYRRTVSFASSGVSIHAQPEAVEALRSTAWAERAVSRPGRPEVVEETGGFAGLFRLATGKYEQPLLAASSDGVGPKLAIAQQLDMHDTIGVDLVAMVVDDIVACGAEPLFVQYYLSCGEVVPERVAAIIAGIRDGCRVAGCAMLGGETAEHAEVLRAHEYDLSGSGIGVVDEDRLIGAHRVQIGDVIVAMGSSGLHANGYGLIRHALLGIARMRLDTVIEDLEHQRTLGQELLAPTRIYARDCLDLMVEAEVRALAHVTGGGIAGNLARILPEGVDAVVRRSSWRPQPIFDLVASKGRIEPAEMESTFNMGIGMAAVVAPDDAERAVAFLRGRGIEAWMAGEIEPGTGTVQLVGAHTRG